MKLYLVEVKTESRKVAIIDMGTNTFHLLLALIDGGKFTIIHREKIPVKIPIKVIPI